MPKSSILLGVFFSTTPNGHDLDVSLFRIWFDQALFKV